MVSKYIIISPPNTLISATARGALSLLKVMKRLLGIRIPSSVERIVMLVAALSDEKSGVRHAETTPVINFENSTWTSLKDSICEQVGPENKFINI